MKIVCGGQTGVDMAALDVARHHGLNYGGWVPLGRTNEDGRIPDHFTGLSETTSTDVAIRTRCNVVNSDATLIFIDGSTSPGTDKTVAFAQEASKPFLLVDVREGADVCSQRVRAWLDTQHINVLNIAGPRASEAPQINAQVRAILESLMDLLNT